MHQQEKLQLLWRRFANVVYKSPFDSSKLSIDVLCLTQVKVIVRTATNQIGIMLVLPIILSKAHWTDFVMAPSEEHLRLAAWASVTFAFT